MLQPALARQLPQVKKLNAKSNMARFNLFRSGVRGRTDRFIATFEKPKA